WVRGYPAAPGWLPTKTPKKASSVLSCLGVFGVLGGRSEAADSFALHVEEEVDDVAVLDEVVLAFHAHRSLALRRGLGAVAKKLLPADDLRLDEAALEVGVDDARRLGGPEALADHAGAALVLADREVPLQPQQREPLPHQLVQAGLAEPDVGEEVGAFPD